LAVAAAVGLVTLQVSLPLLATLGIGAVCLAWLVVIVVLPWNLYFQARHLLFELDRSRRRGITVDDDPERTARQVSSRMLRISLGLHLGSAAALSAGAWLSGQPLGFAFAGLFLLSTLFRPGVEYYRYLRAHLSEALNEVKYPRDDVHQVIAELSQATKLLEEHRVSLTALQRDLGVLREGVTRGDRENQRRLEAVARRFEETIDRLTDNQEIISGIKAFLRLVQSPKREAIDG
jgi:hypothetical protein